jgi:hypothetical protein
LVLAFSSPLPWALVGIFWAMLESTGIQASERSRKMKNQSGQNVYFGRSFRK